MQMSCLDDVSNEQNEINIMRGDEEKNFFVWVLEILKTYIAISLCRLRVNFRSFTASRFPDFLMRRR